MLWLGTEADAVDTAGVGAGAGAGAGVPFSVDGASSMLSSTSTSGKGEEGVGVMVPRSDGSSAGSSTSGVTSLLVSLGISGILPPGFPSGWNTSLAAGSCSSRLITSGVGGKSTHSGDSGTETVTTDLDTSPVIRLSDS